jgi:hypothetical protein
MRPLIGIVAFASALASAAAFWYLDRSTAAGLALRIGVIAAALWLAWPELISMSVRRMALVAVIAGIVLIRPRSAFVVVPVFLVWLATNRQGSRNGAG